MRSFSWVRACTSTTASNDCLFLLRIAYCTRSLVLVSHQALTFNMMMDGLARSSGGFDAAPSSPSADNAPFLSAEDYLTPEEQEQEAQVPHLDPTSTCKSGWIFCCVTWRSPILFLIANAIGMGIAHAMTGRIGMRILAHEMLEILGDAEEHSDEEVEEGQRVYMHQMQLLVGSGMTLLALIWSCNTWLFLRKARKLEQQVADEGMQNQDDELGLTEEGGNGEIRPSSRVPTSPPTDATPPFTRPNIVCQ